VVTGDADVAILFAILSDALASVPTLVKGWDHPESESAWTYLVGIFGGLTSFLAITAWTFSQYAFPAYLVIMSVLLVLSIYQKEFLSIFEKTDPAFLAIPITYFLCVFVRDIRCNVYDHLLGPRGSTSHFSARARIRLKG
jgi:hypothetical protein